MNSFSHWPPRSPERRVNATRRCLAHMRVFPLRGIFLALEPREHERRDVATIAAVPRPAIHPSFSERENCDMPQRKHDARPSHSVVLSRPAFQPPPPPPSVLSHPRSPSSGGNENPEDVACTASVCQPTGETVVRGSGQPSLLHPPLPSPPGMNLCNLSL